MKLEVETFHNIQTMLVQTVEVIETPSSYLGPVKTDITWKVASLSGWAEVMENIGHFLISCSLS